MSTAIWTSSSIVLPAGGWLALFLFLLGPLRKVRHQTQRDGKLVQLKMRLEETYRPVYARLARHFRDLNFGFAQRLLCLDGGAHLAHRHILIDPLIEEVLAILPRHEAADLIPHHRLQIMRET